MTAPSRVDALVRAAGIGGTVVSVSAIAPIVSPMGRAADWTCLAVRTADQACFVKLREADAADFVDAVHAAAAARQAAALGVAPALRFAQADALVFDLLPPPWREARLGDLAQPAILAAVLDAKRKLQRGPALPRHWDVFEQIGGFAAVPGQDALRQGVNAIAHALSAAGVDRVPAHADGTVSNIMLGEHGAIHLVDFDCAGMADPYYDIGVVLNEACADEAAWHAGLEAAFGASTPRDLARCRAYAIADDLLWGLWGLSRHAVSARRDLEFLKYGTWRLLRCRMALQRHPDVASQL